MTWETPSVDSGSFENWNEACLCPDEGERKEFDE